MSGHRSSCAPIVILPVGYKVVIPHQVVHHRAGGHPGVASTLTKCMPFQPTGAGGTQPGTGRGNGDAHGLLVVEELDNDVQANGVKSFAPPGQRADGSSSSTVAEAARRSAFADMLAPSNVSTPYSSGLAQAALQSTRTAL